MAVEVSRLKEIPLFADVPDDSLKKIAPFAETEEFDEGRQIVEEGRAANHFYAIQEGTAEVERNGQQVAELGPGDVFGEQGLLEREQRSATVRASSRIRLIKIEHWELSRIKRDMPEAFEELRRQAEARSSGS